MASKILINASHSEEVRVATVENNHLMEYEHDRLDNATKKGCIYKGIVSRIEPSLNAAFVDYGEDRHGFLPASEVSPLLYPEGFNKTHRLPIQELLKKDQVIVVQVEKEEQGNKGAALTTNISLAGCYLVLMPMTPGSGGISRQIEGEDRDELQKIINLIDIPDHFSIIVRTASIKRSLEDLLWDFNVLKAQWDAIVQCSAEMKNPGLLYHDGALLSRVIRDSLKPSVEEILIDQQDVYQEVLRLVQHIRPDFLWKVKFYDPTKNIPLFAAHQIEHEIESIFNPEVILEDGSTLVFDHREALTSIDINSARATQSADIATTAFNTNMAAAREIPRQIRLRNIGGQIIVDFIHMSSSDNQKLAEQIRQIEQVLKQGLSGDKARVQIGKISKLGLLEISRQRLKTALDKSQLVVCQHCHGRGTHRQPQSVALSILRLIEQEAMRYEKGSILIDVHPSIGAFLFNHYKQNICELEKRYGFFIRMAEHMEKSSGDYEIKFYTAEDHRHPARVIRNYVPSHHHYSENSPMMEMKKSHNPAQSYTGLEGAAHPAHNSFWARVWRFFFGSRLQKNKPKVEIVEQPEERSKKEHSHGNGRKQYAERQGGKNQNSQKKPSHHQNQQPHPKGMNNQPQKEKQAPAHPQGASSKNTLQPPQAAVEKKAQPVINPAAEPVKETPKPLKAENLENEKAPQQAPQGQKKPAKKKHPKNNTPKESSEIASLATTKEEAAVLVAPEEKKIEKEVEKPQATPMVEKISSLEAPSLSEDHEGQAEEKLMAPAKKSAFKKKYYHRRKPSGAPKDAAPDTSSH